MTEQLSDTMRFKEFILYATFVRVRTRVGLRSGESITPTTEMLELKKPHGDFAVGTKLKIVTEISINMSSNERLREAIKAFKALNAA